MKSELDIKKRNLQVLEAVNEKLDILGEAILLAEKVYNKKLQNMSLINFLVYKRLYMERACIENAFKSGQNILDLQNWEEFRQSSEFSAFLAKFMKKNDIIYKTLQQYEAITKKRMGEIMRFSEIRKYVNLEKVEGENVMYFTILYQWFKGQFLQQYNANKPNPDIDEVQLLAKIIDCIIIGELRPADTEVIEFSLASSRKVAASQNTQEILMYIKNQLEHLEFYRLKYFTMGYRLIPLWENQ